MSERSIVKGDAVTAVPWRNTMEYERREVINALIKQLNTPLFESDRINAIDTHHVVCSNGTDADTTDTLVISGRASSSRELLYEKILSNLRRVVADAMLRVRYGVGVKDPFPNLGVKPLQDTPQIRAKRHWFRAMWAMRCGILKKIADARALTQLQIQKTQMSAKQVEEHEKEEVEKKNAQKKKERLFAPLTQYHQSVTSNELDLHRFVNNTPAVVIFWASWDQGSVQYLRNTLFNKTTIEEAVAEKKDPWVQFCAKYVTVKEDDDDEGGGGTNDASFNVGARSPTKVTVADPFSSDGGDSSTTPRKSTTAGVSSKRRNTRHIHRKSKAGARGAHRGGTSKHGGVGGQSTMVMARRAFRVCNIVLISVDVEEKQAQRTIDTLREESDYFMSSKVHMHSLWVGEDGMHSKLATHFDLTSLPVVCGAMPPPSKAEALVEIKRRSLTADNAFKAFNLEESAATAFGGAFSTSTPGGAFAGGGGALSPNMSHVSEAVNDFAEQSFVSAEAGFTAPMYNGPGIPWCVPRITSLIEINKYARHRKSIVPPATARALDANFWAMPQWHDWDSDERRQIIKGIVQVMRHEDAPVTFESSVTIEYPMDGSLQRLDKEADIVNGGEQSSALTLSGSASTHFMDLVKPFLSKLENKCRNFDLDMMVIEDSAPIVLPLNERTAEHRVKGWNADLTCCHCGKRIVIDEEHHFHCLQCPKHMGTFCATCQEDGRHEPSHVVAKLRAGCPHTIPVLWGPSNVASLPTMHGKLVESSTKWHVGVYCNMCHQPIKGVRWKCMVCHDVDLCANCEWSWFENVKNKKHDRRHPIDHYFMRVACAVPGDSSAFLIPKALS